MSSAVSAAAPEAPERLRCEYLEDPLTIDHPAPRLSWEVRDAARGAVQTAYQVQVATSEAALEADAPDLWDSGKVESDETAQVAYAGTPLSSMQRCWWRVRTWDGANVASPWSAPAHWGMGLLTPDDWQSAQWIAEPTPVPRERRPHNGFHSDLADAAEVEKWVAVDLGESRAFDRVALYPARPYDWQADVPGFLFPLRYRIELADAEDFSDARTVVDETAADVRNPESEPRVHVFAPQSARYVRLLVTQLRMRDPGNHGFALSELAVRSGDEERAIGAQVTASGATVSGGWSLDRLVDGETEGTPGVASTPLPATMLRKGFSLDAPVQRATLYATALGVYSLRLNGTGVGDHVLAPGWTDYDARIAYQAYDVTELLRQGENALGALLGDGWCVGRIGMSQMLAGKLRRVYRDKTAFLMRLHIELADGTATDVVTDASWSATLDGPIRVSDLLDGEYYDARMEQPGWSEPGFAAPWTPAVAVDAPDALLVGQPDEPLRVVKTLPAVALTEPTPGAHVFDLGQNMAGSIWFRMRGGAGEKVTLRYAEMLKDDGTVYVENLRGAPQIDTYVLRGDPEGETFHPRFTFHGFRYVEVTGLSASPGQDDLVGAVVCTDAEEVGAFECSEPLLNQLWRNILWTQRANQVSVPTDCPQRDERLGWQGDFQAFCQTAIYNMDVAAFLAKCAADQRDAQTEDGRFPDFAPHLSTDGVSFTGAPAWGDAGVLVPWTAYVNYGDLRLIEAQYDAARRWVDYVHANNPDLIWRNARGNDYNDWLNSDTFENLDLPKTGGAVPNEVFATAFFARSAELTGRMAALAGEPADAARYGELAQAIRRAFRDAFVDAEGRVTGDTQAGYALALSFDLLPPAQREAAVSHLLAALERFGGRLSTGIQTTHRLMLELARNGLTEQAYTLALHRDIPSWGFMIDQGATTIWERWDGYVPGRGFQNPGMNSFNHWAFGAIGEWMYSCVLGLTPDPDEPGYRRFHVRPLPGGGLTHAKGRYRSIRGEIGIAWRDADDAFELDLTVPPNASATVTLPYAGEVTESGRSLADCDGVSGVHVVEGRVQLRVTAGTYAFRLAKAVGGA